MPRVALNANEYATKNVGRFFTANNETPADGNLTGQCVTLNKWFLSDMTNVPAPFSARGDARYVGDTLVRQGHAVEIPYDQRKPGDFVIYKYGQYGHIGVLLRDDRIFEQNVNVGGVARKLVDGQYVYASRIGSLSESWRPVRPNIYRIKSYLEEDIMTEDGVRFGILAVTGGKPFGGDTKKYETEVKYWTGRNSTEFSRYLYGLSDHYMVSAYTQIATLTKKLAEANNSTDFVPVAEYAGKPSLYVKIPK
jgi:hypothetical protein